MLRGIHFPTNARTVALISDFTICCCAVTLSGLATHADFFADLAGKQLRLHRISFPLATLDRLQKFAARGFVADAETILALARAVQRADLENEESVQVQLPHLGRAWPSELALLQATLFRRAFQTYLKKMRTLRPELDADYPPPQFDIASKREAWVETFARWTEEQAGQRDLLAASRREFVFQPQGRETALFMTMEEVPPPAVLVDRAEPSVGALTLPTAWAVDHTLDVAKYVGALFPQELQQFVRESCELLVLHDSDFAAAHAFAREQGFSRVFAFKGDRGEVRGRAFVAVSDTAPWRYRFVAYQARGRDAQKLHVEAIGPFFGGKALLVEHRPRAPISRFKNAHLDFAIGADDLVVIGYQNALWRVLSAQSRSNCGEWRREYLTDDGIEIDRFCHEQSGLLLYSVRNMYGDEILEMLQLLWEKGARRFVYLGSTGALDAALRVGDLVLPTQFYGDDGRWSSAPNDACAWPMTLSKPQKIWCGTRHGWVATVIEETRALMANMAGLGIQAIDIEARHFAAFFRDRNAKAAIILAVTDLPLGETKLDEGYETSFAGVKSICQIVPALLNSQGSS